jgi:endonuclease YncB( thermonuclease family)
VETRPEQLAGVSIMKKWIALTLMLFGCLNAWAGTVTGTVIAISDGDTIRVLDAQRIQYKVRLAGIDAPESKQAYGARSKKNLSDLVFGKTVTIEFNKHDRYGRIVGKVLHDNVDVDLQQIEAGFAWHYKQYVKEQLTEDRMLYADAEVRAQAAHLGLWRDPNRFPPWEWRRGLKSRLH